MLLSKKSFFKLILLINKTIFLLLPTFLDNMNLTINLYIYIYKQILFDLVSKNIFKCFKRVLKNIVII